MAKIKDDSSIRRGISNSKLQDSAAKLIFGNNRLCSQFLRDYSGIEILKDVQEEDIEDMTTRYIPMFTEERDSDVVKNNTSASPQRKFDCLSDFSMDGYTPCSDQAEYQLLTRLFHSSISVFLS